MRIYVGSDHAGFERKQQLIEHLQNRGFEVDDSGAFTYDAQDDYPGFCIATAQKVIADESSLGIVLGGSGNGEQISANKVKGIRCALGWSVEIAQLARQHNNAQMIALGGRMHTLEESLLIIDAFIDTPFSGDARHERRIIEIDRFEETGKLPDIPS